MEQGSKVKITGLANNPLAEACVSSVVRCAEANSCFSPRGLVISEQCVSTISKQIVADKCLSAAFGLGKPQ
jgi:hypothetical protein